MGVYIKGMKMPNSCYDCRLFVDSWCYAFGIDDWRNAYNKPPKGERLDNCPLIEVPEWVPVTKRLPKPFENVLVYLFKAQSPYIAWINKDGDWETEEFVLDDFDYKPTAWMPLSEPPKEEEK